MKIEILKDSTHLDIIATFDNAQDFYNWQKDSAPDLHADRVVIDGFVYMGWDEIESVLG